MSFKTANSTVKDRLDIISKKDPVRMVLDNYDLSKKALNHHREKWLKIFKSYHGYVDRKVTGRANLHYRKLFPQIESEAARFILSYFSSTPFTNVFPLGDDMINNANKMESTQQFYNELCPVFYLSKLSMVKYTSMYGAAFEVPSWRKTVEKVKRTVPFVIRGFDTGMTHEIVTDEVTYEGLWFDVFGPNEVFPYPLARNQNEMPWVIIEEFVHIDKFAKMGESGAFDKAEVMNTPLNNAGQQEMQYKIKQEAIGHGNIENDSDMIRILHYFSKDRFISIANDTTVIRDTANKLDHREIPIIKAVKTFDPESFYPPSSGDVLLPYEKIYRMFLNSGIDSVISNMWPMWKYRKKAGIDTNQLLNLPNQRIGVEHMDDVDLIRMPETKHDILTYLALISSNMEQETGFFGAQKGYSSGKVQSATSDAIFLEQGNKRIQFDVKTFEQLTLNPEARQVSKLIQQFMSGDNKIRTKGSAGFKFEQIKREELQGEYQFVTSGGSQQIHRAIVQKQLIDFYAQTRDSQQFIRVKGNVVPVPLVDSYNYLKVVFDGWDQNIAEQVLLRPEVFGEPVTNELLNEFNMPGIEGLDSLPFKEGSEPGSGNLVNPNINPRAISEDQIINSPNRKKQEPVRTF